MSNNSELSVRLDDLTADDALERLTTTGLLLLKVSDVERTAMQQAYVAAANFFEARIEEKIASQLPCDSGYRPYGVEYSQSAAHPDQVESFTMSYRVPDAWGRLTSERARLLYKKMGVLFGHMEDVAERVIRKLARQLTPGLAEDRFRGALRGWSLLQMNCSYQNGGTAEYANHLHEDGCLVTVMANTGPGLEIQNQEGSCVPLDTSEDELLVIPGEILWLLSGGGIRPTYHQVRAAAVTGRRLAALFFADIDPRLCAPWVSSPINRSVDIGDRVLKNASRYGLAEWTQK